MKNRKENKLFEEYRGLLTLDSLFCGPQLKTPPVQRPEETLVLIVGIANGIIEVMEKVSNSVPSAEKSIGLLSPEFDKGVDKLRGYELEMPRGIIDICEEVRDLGGVALLVGGCVRDAVLRKERGLDVKSKDFDVEIFGLSAETIQEMLRRRFGRVKLEGKRFAVFKVRVPGCKEIVDVSLPRRERKVAKGRQGFLINADPGMSFREAARRRELRMGALGYDPLEGVMYDAYAGVKDIKEEVIRVVDRETFREDAVRVWRIAQFAPRFDFKVSEETVELCRGIVSGEVDVFGDEIDELSIEQVTEEWRKLLLKGIKPSVGLEFMREVGLIEKFYPELHALVGMEQEEDWHPEGDVWAHTLQTVDAAVEITEREIAAGTFLSKYDFSAIKERVRAKGKLVYGREMVRLWEKAIKKEVPGGKDLILRIKARAAKTAEREHVEEVDRRLKVGKGELSLGHKRRFRELEKLRCEELRVELLEAKIEELVGDGVLSDSDLKEFEAKARSKQAAEMVKQRKQVKADRIRDLKLALHLAALLHDVGKGKKGITRREKGKITSKGHEQAGKELAEGFLDKFTFSEDVKKMVLVLAPEHRAPKAFWEQGAGKSALTRLAVRLAGGGVSTHLLALLAEADQRGRNPDGDEPLVEDAVANLGDWRSWFENAAREVKIKRGKPERMLKGGVLIEALSRREAGELGKWHGGEYVGVVIDLVLLEQMAGERFTNEEEALQRGLEVYDELAAELGDPRDREARKSWSNRCSEVRGRLSEAIAQVYSN